MVDTEEAVLSSKETERQHLALLRPVKLDDPLELKRIDEMQHRAEAHAHNHPALSQDMLRMAADGIYGFALYGVTHVDNPDLLVGFVLRSPDKLLIPDEGIKAYELVARALKDIYPQRIWSLSCTGHPDAPKGVMTNAVQQVCDKVLDTTPKSYRPLEEVRDAFKKMLAMRVEYKLPSAEEYREEDLLYAFEEYVSHSPVTIVAYVKPENKASLRILEKVGFVKKDVVKPKGHEEDVYLELTV